MSQAQDSDDRKLSPRLIAETIGTFALTLIAGGTETVAHLTQGSVGPVAAAFGPALIVTAMVYSLGKTSGAHFNPAVTLGFALRGDFPWARVPAYWSAELVGALLAAGLLRWGFGEAARFAVSEPHSTQTICFGMEIVLTFFLVTVAIATASQHAELGPEAAVPTGATIAACTLFGLNISGASMNPARSLGPAIVFADLGETWIYLAGPLLGATMAAGLSRTFRSRGDEEEQAAQGEGD